MLAADEIAQVAEDERPERADAEAGAERRKARQKGRGLVPFGKEQPAEEHGQAAVEIEVVPLEEGFRARRRRSRGEAAACRRGASRAAEFIPTLFECVG